MIRTINSLLHEYKDYSDPNGKIRRDVNNNLLFPVIRGLYETDESTSGLLLASAIYGPSYISFDYALAYHGLIPERVYLYTSATFNKRKTKYYKTTFGNFLYKDIPKEAYPYGIDVITHENKYVVFMATPEKALLDKLYSLKPVQSQKDLISLIFEDLRIDEDKFKELDKEVIFKLIPKYKSTNIRLLGQIIEKNI